MKQVRDSWEQDKQLARALLGDRKARRQWIAGTLVVALAMIVLGLWVMDAWLAEAVWRFLAWWAACGVVTLWLMMFALFDALMVVREEKSRR